MCHLSGVWGCVYVEKCAGFCVHGLGVCVYVCVHARACVGMCEICVLVLGLCVSCKKGM